MNNIKELIDGTKAIGADGWEAIKTIAKFLNYLMHPSLVLRNIWEAAVTYSFWVCMFVAIFSIIFYGLGFKKCGKYVPGSIAFYALIKMLSSTL